MRLFLYSAVFAAIAGSSHATVLLNETFDDEATTFGTTLNFDSYSSFDQYVGNTDLIASGGYGITCVGGTGGCVDLEGSSAGVTPSSLLEFFFPGEVGSYTISFDLSGNQRNGSSDTVTAAYFVGDAQDTGTNYVVSGSAFTTYTMMFNVTVAGSGHFQIGQSNPSDNIGAILDNVVITFDDGMAPVPLPASGLALLAALGGLGLTRRRR